MLVVAIVIFALSLIVMGIGVLGQAGRGGGLSSMFAGSAGSSFGATNAERNVIRLTTWAGIVWAASVIWLGIIL